VGQRQNS